MNLDSSIVIFIITQLATAGGVYAAIRADMREYSIRITMLEKHNDKPFHSRHEQG